MDQKKPFDDFIFAFKDDYGLRDGKGENPFREKRLSVFKLVRALEKARKYGVETLNEEEIAELSACAGWKPKDAEFIIARLFLGQSLGISRTIGPTPEPRTRKDILGELQYGRKPRPKKALASAAFFLLLLTITIIFHQEGIEWVDSTLELRSKLAATPIDDHKTRSEIFYELQALFGGFWFKDHFKAEAEKWKSETGEELYLSPVEKKLHQRVKSLPIEPLEKNLSGYEELLHLNPDSDLYASKVKEYRDRISERARVSRAETERLAARSDIDICVDRLRIDQACQRDPAFTYCGIVHGGNILGSRCKSRMASKGDFASQVSFCVRESKSAARTQCAIELYGCAAVTGDLNC